MTITEAIGFAAFIAGIALTTANIEPAGIILLIGLGIGLGIAAAIRVWRGK